MSRRRPLQATRDEPDTLIKGISAIQQDTQEDETIDQEASAKDEALHGRTREAEEAGNRTISSSHPTQSLSPQSVTGVLCKVLCLTNKGC